MKTVGIDQQALIEQFSKATSTQGEAVRQAVEDATLQALQGRELTLQAISEVLKQVTNSASTGAARNSGVEVGQLLSSAVGGMDAAVLQAVEANRRALQQLVDQGVNLREQHMTRAMGEIEKMEDALFASINAAAGAAAQPLQGPWTQALQAFKLAGSATGGGASEAIEQLTNRAQTAAREGRAIGQQAAEALFEHYAALARGVLIGMSSAMSAPSKGSASTRKRVS